jgi:imidazolonepropionase-like amidohydrolase
MTPATAAWLVDAVALPEGDAREPRWLSEGGWSPTPLPHAEALPGRWALPGLVDAHSHVSFARDAATPRFVDVHGARATMAAAAGTGIAVLRDVGGDPEVLLALSPEPGLPHLLRAGRHLAPRGGYFPDVHLPVTADDVVEVVRREAAAGASWVKVVADFPPDAAPGAPAEQTFDLAVVARIVEAARAAGARVAAHVTTAIAGDLVRLGVSSLEHAPVLTEGDLDAMAAGGVAWTPTLCAMLALPDGAPAGRRRVVEERRERLRYLLPRAVARRVPVLTGSDVVGSIPREVLLLRELGLEPVQALAAATTRPRTWLGAEAAGVPASVVTYDADPRQHPEVLCAPAAAVIGGRRVR